MPRRLCMETYDPQRSYSQRHRDENARSAATKEFLLGVGKTNAGRRDWDEMGKYRQHDLTDTDYIQVQGQLEGRASAGCIEQHW